MEKMQADTLLKDADFVVRDYSTIDKNSSIVIKGNKILEIGKAAELEDNHTFIDIHDCSGQILLPGFINTHTHCNETIMRGLGHQLLFHDWVDNVILPIGAAMEEMEETDELYYAMAQLTGMELLASGSTSLIEHSVNFGKRHVIPMATALSDLGIRGAVAKGAEDFSILDRGHVGTLEHEVKATQEFLEQWQAKDDKLVQAWVGPSGIEGKTIGGCTGPLLTELKKLANAHGTYFHTHLAGNKWEVENLKKSKGLAGSIEFGMEIGILDEKTSLAHCIWVGHGEDEILSDSGAKISHCPSCNQICALGVIPLVELRKRGVVCGIGTDGAPQNDSLDMIRDMRQTILLHKIHNMDPDIIGHLEVFRMATESGAEILGIEKLGKLHPDYFADITMVKHKGNLFLTPLYDPLDTLIYAGSGGRDVTMTMVNGAVLYKDGEFKTGDKEQVISRINDASVKIRRIVGF